MFKWSPIEYIFVILTTFFSFIFGVMQGVSSQDKYYKPILIENNLAEYRSDDNGEPVFIVKDSK